MFRRNLANLYYKKKYALVITCSLKNIDCEYTAPESSNDD